MESIKELIEINNKYKLRNIQVIGNVTESNSKAQELYDLVCSGKVTNDDEAAEHFGLIKTDKIYRRKKADLKSRLTNMLFLIDLQHESFNDYHKKLYSGVRDWCSFKIVSGRSARHTAVELAEKSIRELEKIEYTQLILEYAEYLSAHYSSRLGERKTYLKYRKIAQQQLLNQTAEVEAYLGLQNISSYFVNSKSYKEGVASIAKEERLSLDKYLGKVNTIRFLSSYHLLRVLEKMLNHDYPGTIVVCKEAIKLIQLKSFPFNNAITPFYHNQIAAQIYLRDYINAAKTMKDVEQYLVEGHNNWLKHRELYIFLSFHQKDYTKAYEIYQYASSLKEFNKLSPSDTESWKLIEAWIHIALYKNQEISQKPFKLSKFLNELTHFSKDKSGMNIQITLIKTIFLLRNGKYEQIQESIDGMKKYIQRNLDEKTNMRSIRMLRMVTKMAEESFHKSNTISKTTKYLEEMNTVSPNILDEAHDLETVPYEYIWEWMLEELRDEFR